MRTILSFLGKKAFMIPAVITSVIAAPIAAVLVLLSIGNPAGITYTPADYASFLEKSGLTDGSNAEKASLFDLLTDNYVEGEPVSVNATFSSSEFTAYLNNSFAKTPGIEDVQVKFCDHDKLVLSCKVTKGIASLLDDVPEAAGLKGYVWIAHGKTLRMEETLTSAAGEIITKLDKIYVGQIDVTGFVPKDAVPIGTILNILFRTQDSEDFRFSEEGLVFNGSMPCQITKK